MKLGTILPSSTETFVVPSLEAIAFQKDHPAGPELEALFVEYIAMVEAKASAKTINDDKDKKKRFNDITRKHFGINAQLTTNSMLAATMPNVYVPHSAVVRDQMRSLLMSFPNKGALGQDAIKGLDSGKDLGTVNTETAKMTGWLSEQEVPLFLNFNQLVNEFKLSSAEITAICLHEIGHDFEGAASAIKSNQTNQILSDIVRHISNKDRGGDVKYVYRELSKVNPELDQKTVEDLMSGSGVIAGPALFKITQGTVSSLSGSSSYDRTSYESLSDNFAAKMGYAAPLATGLEKLASRMRPYEVFMMVGNGMFGYLLLLRFFNLAKLVLAGSSPIILLYLLLNALVIYKNVKEGRLSSGDYEYDKMNDRINRIRQTVVDQLKDPGIDTKTKRLILEQLEIVTLAQSKTYNMPKPLREFFKLISTRDRRAQNSVDTQQDMADMISNDIFASATRLVTK